MGNSNMNLHGINGKEQELVVNMEKAKIEIIALTETKKKGSRTQKLGNGDLLIYGRVELQNRAKVEVLSLIK